MVAEMSAMVRANGSRSEFFAFFAAFCVFFAFSFRLAGGERSGCVRAQEKKTAKNAKTREERKWVRAAEAT
jgi:hypothetical protein